MSGGDCGFLKYHNNWGSRESKLFLKIQSARSGDIGESKHPPSCCCCCDFILHRFIFTKILFF